MSELTTLSAQFSRMRRKAAEFQSVMREREIDATLLIDEDSVFYFSGYHNYLGMNYGRPSIVVIPREGEVSVILPSLEQNMALKQTWVETILPWTDGIGEEWRGHIKNALCGAKTVGLEYCKTHPMLRGYLQDQLPNIATVDVYYDLAQQRMVKDAGELMLMRQAGEVAVAMAAGARDAIAEGVPEYEIALALQAAGTRKAAELLAAEDQDDFMTYSPMIWGQQIIQTGPTMHMVHKRCGLRKMRRGDSLYACYCNITKFRGFKLGFDRQWFLGSCTDEQAEIYEQTLEAQRIALDMIRPGVRACDVHNAAAQYLQDQGHGICYRTGRAVGYSELEKPELRVDDETVLKEGMTFAVDGAISLDNGIAGRVGDSVVVTKDGYEYLTKMDKALLIL